MLRARRNDLTVLGYPVERIDELNFRGELLSVRYDVLCPITGGKLASYSQQSQAQEFIVHRELACMQLSAASTLPKLAA